ncbi:MAG: hypothetical protein AB1486_27755 [Planctomycetota bacterium]
MKVAFFATASPEVIRPVLRAARMFFGEDGFVVYLRDSFRPDLEEDLRGLVVRSDTVRGRKYRFWRDVRRGRPESVGVIWGGGRDHWKTKLMALAIRAPNLYVFNEHAGYFRLGWESRGIVRRHLRQRVVQSLERTPVAGRASGTLPPWLRFFLRLYGFTLGPLIGLAWLAVHVGWLETKRQWHLSVASLRERDQRTLR